MKKRPILRKLIKAETTLIAFCEKYDVERSSLHRWLNGAAQMSFESAEKIAKKSDVDAVDLFAECRIK